MSTQTVYEYMMENKLIDHLLDACENDEQREATRAYAKDVAAQLDPFINQVRERCKTDEDREALLKEVLDLRQGKKNAD